MCNTYTDHSKITFLQIKIEQLNAQVAIVYNDNNDFINERNKRSTWKQLAYNTQKKDT